MSEFSLPSEVISGEVYDAIVQEMDQELLNAAEADSANNFCLLSPRCLSRVFPSQYDSYPDKYIKLENIKMESNSQQNEQDGYSEDQKNFMWTGGQPGYEQYADPQQSIMYGVPSVPQIPANVDYAGELDFDILITSHTANRNSWIYSTILNKVFINMQNVLPVDVKRNPTGADLYLRATLLYSLPQFAQDLVERCTTHVDPRLMSNRDTDPTIIRHVLRCTNPGSVYMGNPERKEHLSVVTQLAQPQAGVDTVRVNYQFMCKNSCPSGMNRRAVDVIFTLENGVGLVLGRRKLSVRVCSCPKRDKEKEEKEFRENLQSHNSLPHGRKRKLTRPKPVENNGANDDQIIELPSFKIIGDSNMVAVLKFARDRMLSDIHYNKYDEEKENVAKESIQKLNGLIKKFSPE